MPASSEIALDSQCLSYLIDALEGLGRPLDALAEQKVALVRLYLYMPGTLWVTPTVQTEFSRIRNPQRRGTHESWTNVLFGVRPLSRPDAVRLRTAELLKAHPDADDCRILAEAEDIGLGVILTFDDTFVRRLASGAKPTLIRPAQFWGSLGIPPGAAPLKVPALDNPLANEDWWVW